MKLEFSPDNERFTTGKKLTKLWVRLADVAWVLDPERVTAFPTTRTSKFRFLVMAKAAQGATAAAAAAAAPESLKKKLAACPSCEDFGRVQNYRFSNVFELFQRFGCFWTFGDIFVPFGKFLGVGYTGG